MHIFVSNLTKQKIDLKKIVKLSSSVCVDLGLRGELSIVLVGKGKIKSLNYKWRKKNNETDILTFNYPSLSKRQINAEIFINLDDCKKINQYQEFFNKKPERINIVYFLLIHGILHLKGFTDNTEVKRKRMVEKGKKIYNKYI